MSPNEPLNPYAAPAEVDAGEAVARVRRIAPQFGLSEAIRAEGALTPAEFSLAVEMYRRRPSWLIPLTVAAAVGLMNYSIGLTLLENAIAMGLYAVIIAFVLLRRKSAVQKLWRQRVGYFQPRVCLFGDEGIATCTDTGVSVQQWAAYAKATQRDSMVVLHLTNPGMILPIPRSHFENQADWDQFRALVDDKLPRR